MTREQYEFVRLNYPHLYLPNYVLLFEQERLKVQQWSVETLVTMRASRLMSRDVGAVDHVIQGSNADWFGIRKT